MARLVQVLNLSRAPLRIGTVNVPVAKNNPNPVAVDLESGKVRKDLYNHADRVQIVGGLGQLNVYTFEYDFAVHGGAAGAKTLTALNGQIPDNALVTAATLEPITAPTSGGSATIMLGITGNTNALLAATAFDDAGIYDGTAPVVALTAELPLKMTAAVDIIATIATAALTAGKFRVHAHWVPGA